MFDEKRIIVLTNLRSHRLAVFTNEPLMSSGDHTSGDCSEGGSSVRPDTILRGDGIRLGSVANERPAMGPSDQSEAGPSHQRGSHQPGPSLNNILLLVMTI